jgi:flagellar biosynthesis repressor protein FlbT
MGLKITLKPEERMIIGGAVITNGNSKTELHIETHVSILRQKDILNEEKANTPAKRIYFIIQLMYIDEANLVNYHDSYWRLVSDLLKIEPGMLPFIDQISELIVSQEYYSALKATKKMIALEEKNFQTIPEEKWTRAATTDDDRRPSQREKRRYIPYSKERIFLRSSDKCSTECG